MYKSGNTTGMGWVGPEILDCEPIVGPTWDGGLGTEDLGLAPATAQLDFLRYALVVQS